MMLDSNVRYMVIYSEKLGGLAVYYIKMMLQSFDFFTDDVYWETWLFMNFE